MDLRRPLRFQELARILDGTPLAAGDPLVASVATDTRNLSPGALFFALEGKKQDGAVFVADAERKGAGAAVVSRRHLDLVATRTLPLIVVDDVLEALIRLGRASIARCGHLSCVGVTGSCGKSTTKEAIAALLAVKGRTVRTPGNLNSEIGLPLSVLALEPDTRYGVFEMGVDHEGEMQRMLTLLKPEIGVLTNIGISHLEHFGTRERIAKEKSAIFHPGIEAGFIGRGCDFLDRIQRDRHLILGTYARGDLDYEDHGLLGYTVRFGNWRAAVHVMGEGMLDDIAGAVAVARCFGLHDQDLAQGLDGFHSLTGRTTVIDGRVTIIEDCYNASLDSTRSIIDALARVRWSQGGKKVVLGTMKELGVMSRSAHRAVARDLLAADPDGIFLYGAETKDAYDVLREGGYAGSLSYSERFDDLVDKVSAGVRGGDLCLIKGSRSLAMERLVPILKEAV